VFVDGATGVIEMPLYTHGDIWKWLAAAPRTVHEKLRVLRAALCGLEHVHRMGVVHADVKPENVFVDGDGVAKLGDFDVSKEDATRVTMAGTVVGFSPSYAAPEILSGGGASKAGDMYAFGLTLFDIVRGETPIAGATSQHRAARAPRADRRRRVVARVSLVDSSTRCRQSHQCVGALKSPLFAPPAPGRDPAEHQRECTVCASSALARRRRRVRSAAFRLQRRPDDVGTDVLFMAAGRHREARRFAMRRGWVCVGALEQRLFGALVVG
jgi:serine/threonine protein kinase